MQGSSGLLVQRREKGVFGLGTEMKNKATKRRGKNKGEAA